MHLRDRLQQSLGTAYTIERELGGGGMSRVFVAEETRFKRRVVIKVLPTDLAAGLSVERFEREIELAAGLQQANIVPVITAGDIAGLPWYSMPFVEGENLRARMAADRVAINDAIHILRDIAKALAYAHERGIVHRDIKPENVLFSGGTAVVTDFGIAKALDAAKHGAQGSGDDATQGHAATGLTATGTSLGTPAYMAPEQAFGEAIDHRADLYAWGVVAYELLAHEHPFADKTTSQQLITAHIMTEPTALARRLTNPPAWLCDIVHRCLAKSPSDRPQSAADIVDAFARATSASTPAATLARELPSIAVLPFTSIGTDNEGTYFGEGIAEDILNALAHLTNLRVAARASTIAVRGKQLDLHAIGQQLGVKSVLDGTVRRSGKRIRVTAQLVNVADGTALWSERYDREMEDVFAIQDEIATAVVNALRVRLSGPAGAYIVRPPTMDLGAYDLYLRGRFLWAQRGEGLWKSLLFFEQALRQDPDFAAAYSGVADASFLLDFYGMIDPAVTRERALEAGRRAMELDPTLADALASYGAVMAFLSWDDVPAEAAFRRALELNPGHTAARLWLAVMRGGTGHLDDAVALSRQTTLLDPLYHLAHGQLAWWLAHSRRYEDSIAAADRSIELNPLNFLGRYFRAICHQALGNFTAAAADLEVAIQISRRGSWPLAALAHLFVETNRLDEARKIRDELEERSGREYVAKCHLARVNTVVGDIDRAMDFLADSAARRELHARADLLERAWDPVRHDPRFIKVANRVGIAVPQT